MMNALVRPAASWGESCWLSNIRWAGVSLTRLQLSPFKGRLKVSTPGSSRAGALYGPPAKGQTTP